MKNRTTIVLKGKEFPLYETKRGIFNFEQAGFRLQNIGTGSQSDEMAYIFHIGKAVAIREKINFPYRDLDGFVDDEDITQESITKAFLKVRLGDRVKELPDGTIEILSEEEIEGLDADEIIEDKDSQQVGEAKPDLSNIPANVNAW